MTSFEIPYSKDELNSFDVMKGFFEAEVDGKYQSQMSGDDWQWFYMSIPETGAGGRRVLQENEDSFNGEYYDDNEDEGDAEYDSLRYLNDTDASTDDTSSTAEAASSEPVYAE